MTEHHEKLVRQWRKEGVPIDTVCMIFAVAEITGKDPTEVMAIVGKWATDIKKTLYGMH